MMDEIPLLPHRELIADLSLRHDRAAMLKDAIRDRVYVWTTPELLEAVAFPDSWAEAWRDTYQWRVLVCREPIAPLLRLWCWFWTQGRWEGHRLLIKLGLLMRDPGLSEMDAVLLTNFRWQWRFWRGPYYEAAVARGLNPPRWRDTWHRWYR